MRTVAGTQLQLPLLLDSFVAAVNGTGDILLDGRAKPEHAYQLVERARAGIDDARREAVGYRRVATGPEMLDAEPLSGDDVVRDRAPRRA